jgi:hypothetical protein
MLDDSLEKLIHSPEYWEYILMTLKEDSVSVEAHNFTDVNVKSEELIDPKSI